MGIRRTTMVGAFVGLGLVLATTPALAGQVNLREKTVSNTLLRSNAGQTSFTTVNTAASTATNTATETILSTSTETVLQTTTATSTSTVLQGIFNASTVTQTSTNTVTSTANNTVTSTSTGTSTATVNNITSGTVVNTFDQGSASTISETMTFDSQPADVSIEIAQEGMNFTSPFRNSLRSTALTNTTGVDDTSGITQVQSQAGAANVTVGSNAIINASILLDPTAGIGANAGQVVLKNISAVTLVPGFALQNSTSVSVAEIAGMALAAAEGSSDTLNEDILFEDDGTVLRDRIIAANIVTAVDVRQSNINEYSPHDNAVLVDGAVVNDTGVRGTSGVTQVQANSGVANSGGVHNLIVYDATLSGPAFQFEP